VRDEPAVEEGLNRLRYRFGFLAQPTGATPGELARKFGRWGWASEAIGGFTLRTHPETTKEVLRRGDVAMVFLGDVFDEAGEPIGDWLRRFDPADERELHEALDSLGGRFALLVFDGGRMRVYHDPIGSRSVYYHATGAGSVSSHSGLLAAAVDAGRCPQMARYVARRHYVRHPAKCLPGDRTLYRGILGLIPNNLYDSSGGLRRYWPREPLARIEPDAFFAQVDRSLSALAGYVRPRYRPVFGLTGGADTRVAVAAFRSQGVSFDTVTWGHSRLFPGERTIVDGLAEYLGAPHAHLTKGPLNEALDKLARRNSGALYSAPRTMDLLRERIGGRSNHAFIRGWGAEIMRGFYNLHREPMKDLSAAEMARAYASPSWKGARRQETEAYFAEFRDRAGYAALGDLGIDPNDLFYWEHRMGMWCPGAMNVFDLAMPTLVAFNSRRLYAAAWGLPRAERLSKELFLRIVARHDPKLAAFPLAVKPQRGAASKASDKLKAGSGAVKRGLQGLARRSGLSQGRRRRG
jgi:hypothetical protein